MAIGRTNAKAAGGEPIPAWKDPLWVDIEKLYEENYNFDTWTPAYTYRTFALISASDNETVLPAGFDYQTSDGMWYTGSTGGTHTWDKTKDFYDSNGTPYRWVAYYSNSTIVTVLSFNSNILFAVDGISSGDIGGLSSANEIYNYSVNRLLRAVIFKNTVILGSSIFNGCSSLKFISVPNNTAEIYSTAQFQGCVSLEKVDFIQNISSQSFASCSSLKYIEFNTAIGTFNSLQNCVSLERVVLGNNFNTTGLNLTASTKISQKSLYEDIILKLSDRTSTTAGTLTLGSTNLAKLTPAQIAVATAKNWTLS